MARNCNLIHMLAKKHPPVANLPSARWLALAEALRPALSRNDRWPVRLVEPVADPSAFQGWRLKEVAAAEALPARTIGRGEQVIVDFGEHLVGYLRLELAYVGIAMDAPLRLKLVFGEVPAEVCEPFDPFDGTLSRAWLQDELVTLDELSRPLTLPRRYAFRYLRIAVVATSVNYRVRIAALACERVTSAARPPQPLPPGLPPDLVAIDEAGLRTLANCMQTVFEDGPKRDRRLWSGDLRLQALTNYVSFADTALVKRCLYLLAGLARADGCVPACVYEFPTPSMGIDFILDYTALFPAIVLDYARASGDLDTARDLWPVARRQLEIALAHLDDEGLFVDPKTWWLFIDWADGLDKQAAVHGVLAYAAERTLALARLLERDADVAHLPALAPRMKSAARARLFDAGSGLFVSGAQRQVSWASQTWMVLAGIMTPAEGAAAFRALPALPDAVTPGGPYLWHHVIEAMLICGLKDESLARVRSYWGAMIARGATTFWEVFDPADERRSPYRSHHLNSYCHAWSCTPAYFIRRGAFAGIIGPGSTPADGRKPMAH